MAKSSYKYKAPSSPQELWDIHAGIIKHIAFQTHRVYPWTFELDEKISLVFEGMCNALDKWDDSKGVKFITYAYKAGWRKVYQAINYEWRETRPGPIGTPNKYGVRVKMPHDEVEEGDRPYTGYSFNSYEAGSCYQYDPTDKIDLERKVKRLFELLRPKRSGRKSAEKLKMHRKALSLMIRDGLNKSEASLAVGFSSKQRFHRALKDAINQVEREYGS